MRLRLDLAVRLLPRDHAASHKRIAPLSIAARRRTHVGREKWEIRAPLDRPPDPRVAKQHHYIMLSARECAGCKETAWQGVPFTRTESLERSSALVARSKSSNTMLQLVGLGFRSFSRFYKLITFKLFRFNPGQLAWFFDYLVAG